MGDILCLGRRNVLKTSSIMFSATAETTTCSKFEFGRATEMYRDTVVAKMLINAAHVVRVLKTCNNSFSAMA